MPALNGINYDTIYHSGKDCIAVQSELCSVCDHFKVVVRKINEKTFKVKEKKTISCCVCKI